MRECGALLARATGDMRHVIGLGRIHKMVIRRIHELDTYQDAYPFFFKLIKIGYLLDTYRTRIRYVSVSNTRYACSAKYPCNVACEVADW